MLKHIKNELIIYITLFIKQTITTGIFQDNLKIAKVTPLYKKGDPCIADNYRSILLLPSRPISKHFARALYEILYKYFTTNHFHHGQYGFGNEHSTQLAALELIDRVVAKMGRGKIPIPIFRNFSKAFDSLNHKII